MVPTTGNGEAHQPFPAGGTPTDLPPVEPPTAGFIVQLFVIPAAIVAVVVVVWLLFGKLAGGERDAMDYVRTIRDGNEKRRYRAAFELGTLLHNDVRLARDPALLGAMTDLLDHELALPEGDTQVKEYLAVALGSFRTIDAQPPGPGTVDPIATLTRALDPKQPPEVRTAASRGLAQQAARLGGSLDAPEAVRALIEASRDDDADTRQYATYALGFFDSPSAVEALRGRLGDPNPFVRYAAADHLARRGDVAALRVAREMLSPEDLRKNIPPALSPDARNEVQSKVERVELEILQALEESVRRGHPGLAREVRPEVTAQARSGLVSVRTEATALLKSLQSAPRSDPPDSARPIRP